MIYGYIRVSTDKQDTENQKVGVVSKAMELGVVIDSYITDDGVSGTKEPEDRKLGKLLKKIKSGDVIITSELSRLGRSLFMVMRILEHCMKVGATVYAVKEGYELGDNITSKVMAFAFSLAAEIERNMISERTKEALQRKKREGMVLGRPIGSVESDGNTKCLKNHDKIVALRKSKVSISAIARIIKVHRFTLAKYLEMKGLHNTAVLKGAQKSPLEIHKQQIKELISEGRLYKEIQAAVNEANGLTVCEGAYRNFIRKDDELYTHLGEIQTKRRIAANGGMKINKRYQ